MHKNCLLVLHLMHLYFLFELKIKSLLSIQAAVKWKF